MNSRMTVFNILFLTSMYFSCSTITVEIYFSRDVSDLSETEIENFYLELDLYVYDNTLSDNDAYKVTSYKIVGGDLPFSKKIKIDLGKIRAIAKEHNIGKANVRGYFEIIWDTDGNEQICFGDLSNKSLNSFDINKLNSKIYMELIKIGHLTPCIN